MGIVGLCKSVAFLWQQLLDLFAPEQPAAFVPPRITVELPAFNWLDDYGPHWEPGSTAFWLEPRKEADLIAWLRKYRPKFVGEFEAAGLTVTVAPLPAHPFANYNPRSLHRLQAQMALQQAQSQSLFAQYQNDLARQQGLQNQYSSALGGLLGFRLF